jgi:hypothetical protein
MGTAPKHIILLLPFLLTISTLLHAAPQNGIRARVAADSGKYYVEVNNLLLDFVFAGYGLYSPGDYPILTEIPLQNGEKVRFDRIKELTFSGERAYWKEFIEPEKRNQYVDVDENGYRKWSDIEVNVYLVDWENNKLVSRLKKPEQANIFIRGETNRGVLELQVDVEKNKKTHIIFRPNFVMQCTGDKSHLFVNSNHQFCPICGQKLIKITRESIKNNTR